MGLLKSILGQNPAKCEKKGDEFFSRSEWGRAKLEYENALNQMDRRSPGYLRDEPRLQKKLNQAKESLASKHRQTGEELMETKHYEEARELFELVKDLSRDRDLIADVEQRLKELEDLSSKDLPMEGYEVSVSEEEFFDGQDEEMFTALCGTLPEDVRDAYLSYGEEFKAGYLALNRGEFRIAADALSRAMERNSSLDSFIPLEMASACLNLGQYDEARHLLEGFLSYHPDALPGYQLLCEAFWAMGSFDQAEKLLDDCPGELKESVAFFLLRGETLFQAERYGEAISLYRDFTTEYGWSNEIMKGLAKAYEASGNLKNAQGIYSSIMDQCTSCHSRVDLFVKRKFADISFDLGQRTTPMLEMYLSLAREDSPNVSFYYQRVSEIYSSQGNEVEARRFQGFVRQIQEGKGRV
ncbi:MAG: tetratricopeptide repeat protein [Deltaproteobacteria bacterium]|nr:tetratricopeptide repeat protein [Deltaproteobacteria bacterium]